jgi:hypothetical protein
MPTFMPPPLATGFLMDSSSITQVGCALLIIGALGILFLKRKRKKP